MKVLDLPLKKEWYDMIESGIKTEEYREIKPYWEKRLLDYKRIKRYVEDNRKELIAKRLLFPNRPVIEDVCGSFQRGYTRMSVSVMATPSALCCVRLRASPSGRAILTGEHQATEEFLL